jgi:hypothetical protein
MGVCVCGRYLQQTSEDSAPTCRLVGWKNGKPAPLTQILHNVLMLQLLEQLDLPFQRFDHGPLPLLIASASCGQLDLLDRHEQTGLGVHAEED